MTAKLLLLTALLVSACATIDRTEDARRLICAGRADVIADDDKALVLIVGDSLEERKVALAIERVNSCD